MLDGDAERWAVLDAGQRLAAHVFAQQRDDAAREVWVAGNCVVRDGRHALGAEAARRFAAARAAWLRAA